MGRFCFDLDVARTGMCVCVCVCVRECGCWSQKVTFVHHTLHTLAAPCAVLMLFLFLLLSLVLFLFFSSNGFARTPRSMGTRECQLRWTPWSSRSWGSGLRCSAASESGASSRWVDVVGGLCLCAVVAAGCDSAFVHKAASSRSVGCCVGGAWLCCTVQAAVRFVAWFVAMMWTAAR